MAEDKLKGQNKHKNLFKADSDDTIVIWQARFDQGGGQAIPLIGKSPNNGHHPSRQSQEKSLNNGVQTYIFQTYYQLWTEKGLEVHIESVTFDLEQDRWLVEYSVQSPLSKPGEARSASEGLSDPASQ